MNANIYCEPEKFGLAIFEEINDDNASYSFDDFVIFKRLSDGALLWASDSGCSCPSPFESVGVDELTQINDLAQLERDIDEYRGEASYQCCTAKRKQEVLRKVKEYLQGVAK